MEAVLSVDHRALIKSSFDQLMPISNTFVHLFYNRLFECRPDIRPLFTTSIEDQGPKLIYMLAMLVRGIDRLHDLAPTIEALSKRHVEYGVKPEDYQSVGVALIWTLDEVLGDDFTAEVKAAWIEMYNTLAEICINAAYN